MGIASRIHEIDINLRLCQIFPPTDKGWIEKDSEVYFSVSKTLHILILVNFTTFLESVNLMRFGALDYKSSSLLQHTFNLICNPILINHIIHH